MREALEKLVKIALDNMKIDNAFTNLGYTCNPFFDTYGDVIDAICYLLDDRQESIELTKVYQVLNMEDATMEQRIDLLMEA